MREKKIDGISDLRDESDRDGFRVVVELKRDAVPDVVLNQLYRFTPLQTNFGANMVALDGGRPQLMNLKDLLTLFIAFRQAFSTVNDALGVQPDRRLSELVPPEVRAAVDYGRPVAEA